MKSILVICQGFPPYYGGAEHVAYYLAREAQRSGLRVTALTSDIGGRLPPREEIDGIDIVRVRTRKKEWTRHSLPELLSFLRAARRALPRVVEETEPDLCLAHFSIPAGELARVARRRFGVPYAVVLHGSDVPGYQNRRFGPAYLVARPFIRRVWREARHVIAVSTALRDLALRSWRGERIEVVENGVDLDLFCPRAKETKTGAGAPLQILATAQLIERKGLHVLLDAASGLDAETREMIRINIYGRGPAADALCAQATRLGLDQVATFHGLADHAAMPEIMRAADLFVLPALQEGLPLALLEAMASGLAVIATRVGGIPNVITAGQNGWLIEPGDAKALRAALQFAVRDHDERHQRGQAARASVETHAWPAAWARYAELFRGGLKS